jgi:peptidoglycan/LPS O-acetylase OafA/YrhL
MGKQARIPELDGLRGVAILLVIFYHYTNGSPLAPANGLAFYVQRSAAGGWTGVDLFFVLSGFLIGGILIDARGSDSYFRTFYIRRFFRIIPIYYLWICLYIALVSAARAAIQARSFSGRELPHGFEVYAHFLFIQNFLPFASTAVPGMWGAWFGHLWSLAVEEQFYLVAPLMIAWLSPRWLTTALGAIVCCAPVFRTLLLLHVTRIDVTHLMPARADAFALGILAAIVWRTPAARLWFERNIRFFYWTGGLLLTGYGLLCWYAPGSRSFDIVSFGFTWIGIFYALLLLIVLTARNGWVAGAMRMAWLREVGRVSYCMYVIHLMVGLSMYAVLLRARPQIATVAGAAVALLAAIATYAVARLSWTLFEGPLVRIGHEFKYTAPGHNEAAQLATD